MTVAAIFKLSFCIRLVCFLLLFFTVIIRYAVAIDVFHTILKIAIDKRLRYRMWIKIRNGLCVGRTLPSLFVAHQIHISCKCTFKISLISRINWNIFIFTADCMTTFITVNYVISILLFVFTIFISMDFALCILCSLSLNLPFLCQNSSTAWNVTHDRNMLISAPNRILIASKCVRTQFIEIIS